MPKLDYSLDSANNRLKITNTRIAIEARGKGSTLCLCGTFPGKPGSDKNPHQQRIPLGISNNPEGIKQAEAKARLVRDQITTKTFDWAEYIAAKAPPKNLLTTRELVNQFAAEYRSKHELKDRTWRISWRAYFVQLPQDEVLTAAVVLKFILSKPANTQTRRIACLRLQHLLNFAGIELDLIPYKGNHGPSKTKHRDIPTDELIAEWRDRIPNKGWQWVYGIMAAGGLRPHEAFFCEWTKDGLLVNDGKTGSRIIPSLFYPEWEEQWNLKDIVLPGISARSVYEKGRLGGAVNLQFRRYEVPFPPYDLRHATAIRMTTVFKLPITTSSALLGHDPVVHLKTYQKYISAAQIKESISSVLSRSDCPVAP